MNDKKITNLIAQINERLKKQVCGNSQISRAMAYSLLNKGKRLRPLLVLYCAAALNKFTEKIAYKYAWPAAVAVEMIHCYSLIHDDLPSLDNDDFRRGKPSNHIAFDEATAILAGDALLSDSFAVIASAKINPQQQCMVLSQSIGSRGMILGQQMDLSCNPMGNSEDDIIKIHALKTGKLFAAACMLGVISNGADKSEISLFKTFGENFGLAFQILDDLNDLHADKLAKDNSNKQDNLNFVTRFGVDKSKKLLAEYKNNLFDVLMDSKIKNNEGLKYLVESALWMTGA